MRLHFVIYQALPTFQYHESVDPRTNHTDPLDAVHSSARWAIYPSAGGITFQLHIYISLVLMNGQYD